MSEGNEAKTCGATASVVLLQSLDTPAAPFFASQLLGLTVAHCGLVGLFKLICGDQTDQTCSRRDTRVLLCSTDGGKVLRMTQDHHAEARGEAARLRRMGTSRLIMDSYGETRWMGALANTRG